MITLTLEQTRIAEGDKVTFSTSSGNILTGVVTDASDRSILCVQIASGKTVKTGRLTVEKVEQAA